MKNIELYLWWSCGKLDSDGYETDYEVSDEDYNTIVNLVKKYADENCEEDEEDEDVDIYIDPQEFTEEYFCKNAPELYKQMDDDTREELIATSIDTAEDWFDEEEEGCTVEEYIEDNYSSGFYFTEEFLASIVENE